MPGLTERPVIPPYAIAIEYADQHIPVLRLPMDAPILVRFQELVNVLRYSPLELSSDQVCDRKKKGGIGKARRDRSGGPQ